MGDVRVGGRNNVLVTGRDDRPVVMLANGFGCDQNMWRLVAPALAEDFRVVLFDHVGSGKSDISFWDPERYQALDGYVDDILQILHELDLQDVIFVGHSVSAMMGVLAAIRQPSRFSKLILVGPSPHTSTTRGTAAASVRPTSMSCSTRSTVTTWAGRRPWRR
jgi:sigma-B regulation protein RsbQ